MTNEEKLHLLIQRVSDLQTRQDALEFYSGVLIPMLLNFIPKQNALEILKGAREAKVTCTVPGSEHERDAQITKLKVEEAIHCLIDAAERKVRTL